MSRDPYNNIRREVPPTGGPMRRKTEYNRNKLKHESEYEVSDVICPFCGRIMEINDYSYCYCKRCKYYADL